MNTDITIKIKNFFSSLTIIQKISIISLLCSILVIIFYSFPNTDKQEYLATKIEQKIMEITQTKEYIDDLQSLSATIETNDYEEVNTFFFQTQKVPMALKKMASENNLNLEIKFIEKKENKFYQWNVFSVKTEGFYKDFWSFFNQLLQNKNNFIVTATNLINKDIFSKDPQLQLEMQVVVITPY